MKICSTQKKMEDESIRLIKVLNYIPVSGIRHLRLVQPLIFKYESTKNKIKYKSS